MAKTKHFFIAILALISLAGQSQEVPAAKSVISDLGMKIPVYDFENFEKLLNTNDDSIYIVNFWATWCAPCVKELPYFDGLAQTIDGRNVKVILVSLDMIKDARTKLPAFVRRKKIKSQVIVLHEPDADAWISKVDKNWSGAIPATLIFSANSRKFFEQSFTQQSLNETINLFINSN